MRNIKKWKKILAWLFIIMTGGTMIILSIVLIFLLFINGWNPLFYIYVWKMFWGTLLIIILLDYLYGKEATAPNSRKAKTKN